MHNTQRFRNRKRKSLIWFSTWVEDHDEGKLSTLAFGAHVRLKQAACRYSNRNNCPPSLPDDDAELSRFAALRPSSWKTLKGQILALWRLQNGRWHFHSLDDDYQYVLGSASENVGVASNSVETPSEPRQNSVRNPLETQEAAAHLDYNTNNTIETGEERAAPPASDWKFWKDQERKLRVQKELAVQRILSGPKPGNGPMIDVTPRPPAPPRIVESPRPEPEPTMTVFAWATSEITKHEGFQEFVKPNAGQRTASHWKTLWDAFREKWGAAA